MLEISPQTEATAYFILAAIVAALICLAVHYWHDWQDPGRK